MSGTPVDIGTLIGGRYRLVSRIGAGGMGTVWRAHDDVLDRQVALKEVHLPPGLTEAERQDSFRRLLREARLGARLRHPAIVPVHDVLTTDDRPWIVMDLLSGRSLDGILKEDGPLPPDQVARIGLALLAALDAAHEAGILHRDVKPANVIIDNRGNPTLTDFGIAFEMNQTSTTATGHVIGSPAYIAPERVRGETAGPPSDLYSLGATLYTAVEGRPPYARESQLVTMAAAVTDEPDPIRLAGWLAPILLGMLNKDPRRRWTSERCQRALESRGHAGELPPPIGGAMPTTSAPPFPQSGPPLATQPNGYPSGTQPAQRPTDAVPAGWASTPYPAAPLSPALRSSIPQSSIPQSPIPQSPGGYPPSAPYQSMPPYQPPPPRRKRKWIGRTIGITVVAVLVALDIGVGVQVPSWIKGVGGIFSGTGPGGFSSSTFNTEGPPVPLPGGDVLLFGYDVGSGQTKASFQRMTPATGANVWKGTELGDIDPYGVVLSGPGGAAVVSKSTAIGFDPATGKESWRQTLVTDLAGPCGDSCAAIVGNHLITLSKDGTVQSFAMTDGKVAWSKRFDSSPRFMHVVGDEVAVDDSVAGGHSLQFLKAATGTVRKLSPSCTVDSNRTIKPFDDSAWFFTQDNASLVVLMSEGDSCAQGYNLRNLGRPKWQNIYPFSGTGPIPSILDDDGHSTVGGIQWTDDESSNSLLRVINPGNGVVRTIASVKNAKLKLRGIIAGVAIVESAPTYDSDKPAVEAYDVASGRQLWHQASRAKASGDVQLVGLSGTTVIVSSCADATGTDNSPCKFEALNPRTGQTLGTSAKEDDTIIPRLKSITSTPTLAFVLSESGRLFTLDPKTAAIKSVYG